MGADSQQSSRLEAEKTLRRRVHGIQTSSTITAIKVSHIQSILTWEFDLEAISKLYI